MDMAVLTDEVDRVCVWAREEGYSDEDVVSALQAKHRGLIRTTTPTPMETEVLAALGARRATAVEVGRSLPGMSRQNVQLRLSTLMDKGLVQREMVGGLYRYRAV